MNESADRIVRQHVRWSVGASLLPFPMVDVAASLALQVRMVQKLAEVYGVEFADQQVNSLVASLLGSLLPTRLAQGSLGSAVKAVPVVGYVASLATVPALTGASTHAVGRVFMKHFGEGGDLWNFDPDRLGPYLRQQFEEGKADFRRLTSRAGDRKTEGGEPAQDGPRALPAAPEKTAEKTASPGRQEADAASEPSATPQAAAKTPAKSRASAKAARVAKPAKR
ncbi:MAG: DUF697 domain-containing protein, partial [Acidobacteriota bacterium]